jgi:membrane protein implicated in regulation of membrane protease activity
LIGALLSGSFRQVEVFGVTPDPTVVGTLGILLLATGRVRLELIALPAIWCAISGASLAAMDAPASWIVPAAAALVVTLAAWRIFPRRRKNSRKDTR